MTLLGFIILALVAAVAGMIGQAIAGYSLGGCVMSSIVGFIGALLGMWLARLFGLPELFPVMIDGETFPVVWSIIGSTIFAAIVGFLTRRRVVLR